MPQKLLDAIFDQFHTLSCHHRHLLVLASGLVHCMVPAVPPRTDSGGGVRIHLRSAPLFCRYRVYDWKASRNVLEGIRFSNPGANLEFSRRCADFQTFFKNFVDFTFWSTKLIFRAPPEH